MSVRAQAPNSPEHGPIFFERFEKAFMTRTNREEYTKFSSTSAYLKTSKKLFFSAAGLLAGTTGIGLLAATTAGATRPLTSPAEYGTDEWWTQMRTLPSAQRV